MEFPKVRLIELGQVIINGIFWNSESSWWGFQQIKITSKWNKTETTLLLDPWNFVYSSLKRAKKALWNVSCSLTLDIDWDTYIFHVYSLFSLVQTSKYVINSVLHRVCVDTAILPSHVYYYILILLQRLSNNTPYIPQISSRGRHCSRRSTTLCHSVLLLGMLEAGITCPHFWACWELRKSSCLQWMADQGLPWE